MQPLIIKWRQIIKRNVTSSGIFEEVNKSEQLINFLTHDIDEDRGQINWEQREQTEREQVFISAGEEIRSNYINRRSENEITDWTDGPHESIWRN